MLEDVGIGEEVIRRCERVSVEEGANGLGVSFEGEGKAATWGGSLQEVGQGEAAKASKEVEADRRGTGAWVVGEAMGIFECAVGRVVFFGAVFVGLKLPGADARICC